MTASAPHKHVRRPKPVRIVLAHIKLVAATVLWVVLFVVGGYAFGNLPVVKRNFQYVILAIIVISIVPMVIEYLRARAAPRATRAGEPAE